jgi:spermidine/putrescine transport system permease protein
MMVGQTTGQVQLRAQRTRRDDIRHAALTTGPGIAWVSVFVMLPLMAIGVISFLSRGTYGEIELPFTGENYQRFMGFGLLGFDPLGYPLIILRSVLLGAGTTVLCVALGVPMAFFLASLPGRYKTLALTLVVIPFWTNLLIRTYAWQLLLAPHSWLTQAVVALGLATPGVALYPGTLAVYIGMVCDYLPFLVLPLYASVEKLDWRLAEAAADLGANGPRVLRHALLPQLVPGLVAGIILVFIPATGQFVIPDLLGGGKTVMLGNVIDQQFRQSRDWPFGAAVAMLSMAMVLVGLWVYARLAGDRGRELL